MIQSSKDYYVDLCATWDAPPVHFYLLYFSEIYGCYMFSPDYSVMLKKERAVIVYQVYCDVNLI